MTLKSEGLSLQGHILQLIKDKYDVTVPPTDVQACHRLGSDKNVILRIWNRGEGSSWADLCTAIKSGMKPDFNVFANFQLTDRRNKLSFHLRKLKKEKKISKVYTNDNGQLFFKIRDSDNKIKVTYSSRKFGEIPKTMNVDEINHLYIK